MSCLSGPGGLSCHRVLSCLSGPGGLSCRVLYCPVCLALEGSWYPLTSPWKFWGGGSRVPAVGAGPRGSRPRAPKTIYHGLQSSQLRHGPQSSQLRHGPQSSQLRHGPQSSQLRHGPQSSQLHHGLQSSLQRHGFQSSQLCHGPQSSQLHHGLQSSLHRHGFQSSQLRHGPCLSVLLWRSPSCVPVCVCPEGPPERPPPLPDGTVKARDEPFGRGELCQASVVCHVSPPHVSLFGLFPVLV